MSPGAFGICLVATDAFCTFLADVVTAAEIQVKAQEMSQESDPTFEGI